jgi:HSP20 family molecular chaperone IbpA
MATSSFFGSDALSLAAWRTLTDATSHDNKRVVMQRSGGSHFSETDDGIQLSVDIPGVRAKELTVKVDKGILTISGSRKITLEGGGVKKFRFEKNFSIDADSIDVHSIKANLCSGVLILKAPKQKRAGPHFIEVTEENDEEDDDDDDEEEEAASPKQGEDSKPPPVLTVDDENEDEQEK